MPYYRLFGTLYPGVFLIFDELCIDFTGINVEPAKTWLSLGQAADEMGIHPTTLRRWADSGEIPSVRTPGGHRRFALTDLRRFSEVQAPPSGTGLEFAWAGKAMTKVREQLTHADRAPWMTTYSEEERMEHRELGRRLMSVAMHYIADMEGGQHLVDEAALIGRAQASLAFQHGLSLTETLGATLMFRDTLLEVAYQLPEYTHVDPKSSTRLLRGINMLLNAVQLAVGETYDHMQRSPVAS